MVYLPRSKGQIAVQSLAVVAGVLSAVAVPIIWGGKVDAANQVQDVKITNIETQQGDLKSDVRDMNKKLDALLIANGIQPDKLK